MRGGYDGGWVGECECGVVIWQMSLCGAKAQLPMVVELDTENGSDPIFEH